MRIVHIANFYNDRSGGIKTTITHLGNRYQKIGHEFIYLVPGIKFSVETRAHGLQISLPSLPIPFSGGYRVIRSNREIKKILALLNPERIEISDRLTLRKIGLWARSRSIHSVVFSHESLESLVTRFAKFKVLKEIVAWHNRRLAQSFDWVITTTEFAAQEFKRIAVPNLKKIPLGVDLEIFQPLKRDEILREELLQGSEILIVHCGRLSIEKNPEQSLAALHVLHQRGVKARLVYVGMGPLFKRLQKKSSNLPVTFLGYVVNPHKVASLLASADVVLAPGPHETFCLAALESLACGTPVIASRLSAVSEILRINNLPVGKVCGENPLEWADAIIDLHKRQGLRERSRSRAEEFSWSATIRGLIATHDESAVPISTKSKEAA